MSGEKTSSLSKAVLGMKFMKRKEEIKAKEYQERQKIHNLQNGNWLSSKSDQPSSSSVISSVAETKDSASIDCSREVTDLYSTLPGRRSFNGANKAVEKYYQQIINTKYYEAYSKKIKEGEGDVEGSNEARDKEIDYEKLISLPRGPSQGKRPLLSLQQEERGNKKQKVSLQKDGKGKFHILKTKNKSLRAK
jgi:hypothetical protein